MTAPERIWLVTSPLGPTSMPGLVSPSVLTVIERCPRRYQLSKGSYPFIWDRTGYPSRPSVVALAGMVMHRCVEIIGTQVARSDGHGEARFVAAMRALGGFDALVERVSGEVADRLLENPRVRFSRDWLIEQLRRKHQDIREQVQTNSWTLDVEVQRRNGNNPPSRVQALGRGCYFEIELVSPSIGCKGRLDCLLITNTSVEIIDYKTGDSSPEHDFQLQFYQMVWANDASHNPDAVSATKLTLAYPRGCREVEPLDTEKLAEFTCRIVESIRECRSQLELEPAPAKPSPANCEFCDVRQLCEEYWKQSGAEMFTRSSVRPGVRFIDVRLELKERITDSIWLVESKGGGIPNGTQAHLRWGLFRDVFERINAGIGSKLRLLAGSHMMQDDGLSSLSVISVEPTSEVFFEP